MVVTPFGDLALNDSVAEQRWLDAHDRRHKVYVAEGLSKGGPLLGPIDGDWMLRHLARHVALATAQRSQTAASPHRGFASPSVKGLALPGRWKTEQELQDWHLLHNRLHSLIDRIADVGTPPPRHREPPGHP